MTIYLGNKELKELYIGNKEVKEVYKGMDLVWQSGYKPKKPVLEGVLTAPLLNSRYNHALTLKEDVFLTLYSSGSTAIEIYNLVTKTSNVISIKHSKDINGMTYNNDNLYTASADGEVHKYTMTGQQEWGVDRHGGIAFDVDISNNTGQIYSVGSNGNLKSINKDGTQKWSHSIMEGYQRAVTIDEEDYIYTSGSRGILTKISESNRLIFNRTIADREVHSLEYVNGFVFAGLLNGDVVCADADTGIVVWRKNIHAKRVRGMCVDKNDFIYTASEDGYVKKFDGDGSIEWEYNTDAELLSVDVNEDLMLVATGDIESAFIISQKNA